MLQRVEHKSSLSLITLVDLEGRVIIRANNENKFGDESLMREYDSPSKAVSSIRRLLLNALTGKTIQSFEVFSPDVLATENLAEQAKIQLKSTKQRAAPPN